MERFTLRDYAIAYGIIAVLTFGHCGKNNPQESCWLGECRYYSYRTAMGAFFAGALWPLYWSWELQS